MCSDKIKSLCLFHNQKSYTPLSIITIALTHSCRMHAMVHSQKVTNTYFMGVICIYKTLRKVHLCVRYRTRRRRSAPVCGAESFVSLF